MSFCVSYFFRFRGSTRTIRASSFSFLFYTLDFFRTSTFTLLFLAYDIPGNTSCVFLPKAESLGALTCGVRSYLKISLLLPILGE